MPIYEYECLTNGHRFEVRQSFSEDSLSTCTECGEPVRKVFSAAGLVFKGSGYYVNDSRKPKGGGDKGGSGEKTSTGSGSDATSTSSKEGSSSGSGSGSSGKGSTSTGSASTGSASKSSSSKGSASKD